MGSQVGGMQWSTQRVEVAEVRSPRPGPHAHQLMLGLVRKRDELVHCTELIIMLWRPCKVSHCCKRRRGDGCQQGWRRAVLQVVKQVSARAPRAIPETAVSLGQRRIAVASNSESEITLRAGL